MNLKRSHLATAISMLGYLQEAAVADGSVAAAPQAPTQETTAAAPEAITVFNAKTPYLARKYKFHFKKDELGVKRPTIELAIPVITLEGVIQALSDEKQAAYILDVLADEAYKAARQQVGNDEKPVNTQEELDSSKLSIEFLANQPKAERTGGGISKETWAEFAKDYVEVMPAVTGKNAEQVGNAAKLLVAKFQPVKTQKKVITFLREQLALWFQSTPNAEDYAECFEFLDNKADTLLKADEASLLSSL